MLQVISVLIAFFAYQDARAYREWQRAMSESKTISKEFMDE